jgi:heme/copper-type cytochrome/quinol oxidase subunit 1
MIIPRGPTEIYPLTSCMIMHGLVGLFVLLLLLATLFRDSGISSFLEERMLPFMRNLNLCFHWLSCELIPIALKSALMQLGVLHPIFWLLYYPLPLEKRKESIEIVKAIGLDNFK